MDFSNCDWFSSQEVLNDKMFIYVKYMNQDVLSLPDIIDNKKVYVHFDISKNIKKETYVLDTKIKETIIKEDDLIGFYNDIDDLLEKNTKQLLMDIFHEIHDGNNAVTSISADYPDVYGKLSNLYYVYGYDVIYDTLND